MADFTNKYDVPLNYKIYESREDFLNDVNPVYTAVVPANSKTTFQLKAAEKRDYFFVDVYSDDYSISNWAVSRKYFLTTNDIFNDIGYDTQGGHLVYGNYIRKTLMRKFFLDGNKPHTIWHAVGCRNVQGQSIWNTFTPDEQFLELKLSKDNTVFITTKDSLGAPQTINTEYSAVDTFKYMLVFANPAYTLTNHYGTQYDPLASDTATLTISNRFYQMVKDN